MIPILTSNLQLIKNEGKETMWILIFNILITLIIAVIAVGFIVSIILLAALFIPIVFDMDSTKGRLLLTFPGGKVELVRMDGLTGLEYSFLWKKGFKSIREMFRKKKEKNGKSSEDSIEETVKKAEELEKQEQETNKTEKAPEKKKKWKNFKFYLDTLKREEDLVKRVLKTLLLFLWDIFRLLEMKKVDGTFCLPDPYYNGLCCAVLAPLTHENFSLMPNFDGKFNLTAKILIMPSKVVWQLLRLFFSLPVIRLYRLYKKLT